MNGIIVANSDKARQVLGRIPHAFITKIIEDARKCILLIQTATKRTCENGL